jgi:hypothetical protein
VQTISIYKNPGKKKEKKELRYEHYVQVRDIRGVKTLLCHV